MRFLALTLILLAASAPALAANPSEVLSDPALEERAREISKEVRCLVCQNQSIDDSDADLAKDLRVLVRERLTAGDTDEEVMAYLTDRYGAFVRLRPPFNASTIALWVTPFVVVLIAAAGGVMYVRRRRTATDAAAPLSEAEEDELAALLSEREQR